MKPNYEHYAPEHYAGYFFDAQQKRTNTAPLQAKDRAKELRNELVQEGFSLTTITAYKLDNPFMTEDARAVMKNYARRYRDLQRRNHT